MSEKLSQDILKVLIKYFTKQALEFLGARVPFFSTGIMSGIASIVLQWLISFLLKKTSMGLSILWFAANNSDVLSKVEYLELRLLTALEKGEPYESIEKNYHAAIDELVHFSFVRVSASPT